MQVRPRLEFLQALQVWRDEHWLRQAVPIRPPAPEISLCTDASLQGWGAHLLPEFVTISGLWTQEERPYHINDLELLAVRKAVQHWRHQLANKVVLILSDNSTVVAYINKQGGTKSRSLCGSVSILLQFAAENHILLTARHIPGRLNVIADALSRTEVCPTEWTLSDAAFRWINGMFPDMTCDAFATRYNRKLPRFFSPFPDSEAAQIDALSCRWSDLDMYAFPPTPLIAKVLVRLETYQGYLTLVAPLAPHRAWFTMLTNRLLLPPVRIPPSQDLLTQPLSGIPMPEPEKMNLHVFRLYGGPLRPRDIQIKQWLVSLAAEGSQL